MEALAEFRQEITVHGRLRREVKRNGRGRERKGKERDGEKRERTGRGNKAEGTGEGGEGKEERGDRARRTHPKTGKVSESGQNITTLYGICVSNMSMIVCYGFFKNSKKIYNEDFRFVDLSDFGFFFNFPIEYAPMGDLPSWG
jgi:hypothetical protein